MKYPKLTKKIKRLYIVINGLFYFTSFFLFAFFVFYYLNHVFTSGIQTVVFRDLPIRLKVLHTVFYSLVWSPFYLLFFVCFKVWSEYTPAYLYLRFKVKTYGKTAKELQKFSDEVFVGTVLLHYSEIGSGREIHSLNRYFSSFSEARFYAVISAIIEDARIPSNHSVGISYRVRSLGGDHV